VCILLNRYPPDFTGHGIQIERLLPHLARQEVEARVVTRRPVAGVTWEARDDGSVLRILPAPDEGLSRLRGTLLLRAHLRRHRRDYDVVHGAFADWEFYLNVAFMKRLGLPVLHEMVLVGADDPVAIRAERLGSWKLRLLRRVDCWVGISSAFLPRIAAVGIPEDRFQRIYTGLDVERFRPVPGERRLALRAALGIPAEARVVITVGALLPRKGMDRLMRAWERLAPSPEKDLLLLVGPSTESEGLRPQYLPHVRELETLAGAPGLAGTVRLVGRVDDVERWMGAADVFALLSRREGFGTVTAEAMACGLPCVISPLDGIGREIVDEGRTGFVIDDPDDPDAVAARLRLLLSDGELRRRLGTAARESASARFSMEVRAERLAEIYRTLAARSSS
jgi:glycosyltransferase involved in cell wall biosynthesis